MSDDCECGIWEKGVYRRKYDETDNQEISVRLEHEYNTFKYVKGWGHQLGTTSPVMVTTSVSCAQKNSKLSS